MQPNLMKQSDGNDAVKKWTVQQLFRRRVGRFWQEQWRVWRTALDWTVWVYILLPALVIGGGLYVDLWTKPPEWLASLPLWTMERLPFAVVAMSRLRTFAEEADVLFLQQMRPWSRKLTAYGAVYTAVSLIPFIALLLGLAAPSLIGLHHLGTGSLLILFLFTLIWAMLGAVWRNLIEGRYRGWRKAFLHIGLLLLLAVTYMGSSYLAGGEHVWLLLPSFLGAAAVAISVRMKLRARDTFDSDVQQEHKIRLAVTALLLRDVIERRPRIRLNRPLVLRSSKRLFRRFDGGTIVAELVIKILLRRMALLRMWLSFGGLAIFAILLSPGVLKLVLLVLLPLPLTLWVQSHWSSIVFGEAFFSQFHWKDAELIRSAETTRQWLVAPVVCLQALIAGLQLWGTQGLLLAIPAVLLWWSINKLLFPMLPLKNRKGGR
ncbi:ABC transporter permease [Paenibacillus oenotherae]|uniref:ABC transporter permease n=1 Tax=Paenibacillus oenotherae TaxID=1435645 RepID=A0ABS7DA79_9BACL|nr:ABC transporter permease [Paenibacillus oenotherae]MBW7476840.1 ABC transporter permease [Paenibacillus oenotherae]